MPDMELQGNDKIPGVDMERKETPQQVVEINDPEIPQDPSLIAHEVTADTDEPT